MKPLAVLLLAALAVTFPFAAAAETRPATPAAKPVAKTVWTSEQVEALRDRGLISIIGLTPAAPSEQEAAAASANAPRPVRAKDPDWYRGQIEKLRDQIASLDALIVKVRREVSTARYWEGGLNLGYDGPGITPDSTIEVLQVQKRVLEGSIDALQEQARRNSILPGEIR